MSKYSDLESRLKVLEKWAFSPLPIVPEPMRTMKFKGRFLYQNEPITPWREIILFNITTSGDWATVFEGKLGSSVEDCIVDGYEYVDTQGRKTRKSITAQCFSARGSIQVAVRSLF